MNFSSRHWEKSNISYGCITENRVKDIQRQNLQHFAREDFYNASNESLVTSMKKKSGLSDPRFKKILNHGIIKEPTCEKGNLSATKLNLENENVVEREITTQEKIPNLSNFLLTKNSCKPSRAINFVPCTEKEEANAGNSSSKRIGVQSPIRFKKYSSYEIPQLLSTLELGENPRCKTENQIRRSVSDCTLFVKNKPFNENAAGGDISLRLQSFTSTTKLSRINNWICKFKPYVEKRRSVITIIGQTRGKSYSAVLNEINQRRKLAKELDRHALCETILQTAKKQNEMKNIIAKTNFVSPDGKIIYTTQKMYGYNYNFNHNFTKSNCKDFTCHSHDTFKTEVIPFKKNSQIPENDTSRNQSRKRKSRRGTKNTDFVKLDFKGVINLFFAYMENQLLLSIGILICSIVFCFVFLMIKDSNMLVFFLNFMQPKTKRWYDNLFSY